MHVNRVVYILSVINSRQGDLSSLLPIRKYFCDINDAEHGIGIDEIFVLVRKLAVRIDMSGIFTALEYEQRSGLFIVAGKFHRLILVGARRRETVEADVRVLFGFNKSIDPSKKIPAERTR